MSDFTFKEVGKNEYETFMEGKTLNIFFKIPEGYKIEDYPQAYDNYKGEISLPIYPQLTDEQVQFIIDTVVSAYNKVK